MFSQEERCIYERNPIADVICQLRFPEILSINTQAPAEFQETIRGEYPLYAAKQEVKIPKLQGAPGSLQNNTPSVNHQFTSEDGCWRVNLTSTFISLSCSKYTCWEDFAKKLDKPLAAFIKLYKPAFFQRVGLRYVNFVSRKALDLEELPFRELIESPYLGILADEEILERNTSKCCVDVELAVKGGCRANIHAGPGLVKRGNQQDSEIKFIFDLDLYMSGKVPVNLSAGALETLHSQAYPIFRGAITSTLHRAMDPIE